VFVKERRSRLNTEKKLGVGSMLATVGAVGIVLFPLMHWTDVPSPWDFLLGFAFGLMAGVGAALAVWGLLERRSREKEG
jgi:hypothetical protein